MRQRSDAVTDSRMRRRKSRLEGLELTDGTYEIEVETDSSMFRAETCLLKVEGGSYTAVLSLPGEGFSRLYFGSADEAAGADESDIYDYELNDDGLYTFELPVEELDEELEIAAYGQARHLVRPHDRLPCARRRAGSGCRSRCSVGGLAHESHPGGGRRMVAACAWPCLWGVREPRPSGGRPVTRGAGSPRRGARVTTLQRTSATRPWQRLGARQQMDLQYARCFTIDSYEGGYQLLCLADGNRYLVVPEGAEVPTGIDGDIIVLQQPVGDIYLVASDSMCLFDALDALDAITVSGIERDDWHIAAARDAMDAGDIVYGGKYRAPDYELLLSKGVRLAVESTMINHNPDVREKLIELGIPVLVELSSYEDEPLGRTEWIRLYGALLGCDDLARQRFQEQVDRVGTIAEVPSGKTVAFFYLNSNGAPVVRRPGDYVTKMIERAGGTYAFDSLEAATMGRSSITLQMEQFYALTKDADVLIYNGSIDDTVASLDALLAKCDLLADFKAVREGNVWVTEQSMYQQMMATGDIIADFNHVLRGR